MPDIISSECIFCDVKVIVFKAKNRLSRKSYGIYKYQCGGEVHAMFYLLRTKYRRKFDLLMSLSQSEILSLCYYFPYYSDHLLDHIKIHVFFMLIIVSFFWQTHYPFGEFSIQSKLNPNMIHDACHANSSLNWIKAYDC